MDTIKKIKDINIGDVLKNGSKVVGKINLGTKQMYSYRIKNALLKGSRNLIYYDNDKKHSTMEINTVNSPFKPVCDALILVLDEPIHHQKITHASTRYNLNLPNKTNPNDGRVG